MDSHTFVHVVSKWPALRLSNQCSFTRVSNSYTYREVMFFFSNKTGYKKKKKGKSGVFLSLLLFPFKGGISEIMTFRLTLKSLAILRLMVNFLPHMIR